MANPISVETQDQAYFLQHLPSLLSFDTIFTERSKLLLPLAKKVIRTKWPQATLIERLIDVDFTKSNLDLAIAGLIYKECKNRPNAIKIFQKERNVRNIYRYSDKFIDSGDTLFIEDSHARIKLAGNIDVSKYTTGIPLAVRGTVDHQGDFVVQEVTDLGLAPQLHGLSADSGMRLISFSFNALFSSCSPLPTRLYLRHAAGVDEVRHAAS